MKIGPKYKLARRLGAPIFEKTQTQKYALREQQKDRGRRRGRVSDYGRQLSEKQKARLTYGVTERQFRNYVRKAMETRGVEPTVALFNLLERRLDNVVFRMGLAPTKRAARQRVSHGHLMVNGRRVTVPSYSVKDGDVIKIREASQDKPMYATLDEDLKNVQKTNWLSFDLKKKEGKVSGAPKFEASDLMFDLGVIVEFYSR